MLRLRGLVDDLGASVLELEAAPAGLDVRLSGSLLLHDPVDPAPVGSGDLVAIVAAAPMSETSRLLHELAGAGAAAVLAKRAPNGVRLGELAEDAGIALLSVQAGASWTQVMQLVNAVLSRDSFGLPGEALGGVQAGDLFAVANVVAELVDAPITIEDSRSRVIAFSGRQEEADAARAATILGRSVPGEWLAKLRDRGVFTQLTTAREPIYISDIDPQVMPRVAVAIRSGDQVLGSIWAAVHERLTPERERALTDAAGYVALHLLHHRLASDTESTLESELVGAVLKGGSLAADAVQRLNLTGAAFRVVGFAVDAGAAGDLDGDMARLRNLAALNLSSTEHRAVTALSGGVVYAIVPAKESGKASNRSVRAVIDSFVARVTPLVGSRVMAGLGTEVATAAAIPGSRETADAVLRVLRTVRKDIAVAELGDVRASLLMMRFADACGDGPTLQASPLTTLRDHDRTRKTAHVETCRAYLDAFGDVDSAARVLGVHPNTVRYRLRQIETVTGISLRDPTERLALELELRITEPDLA